jgi:tripartite ATP-independent transporter DctM subunit
VGDLFKAALAPGLLLGVLYVVFLLLTGWLRPGLAPLPPREEKDEGLARQVLILLRDLIGPLTLVVAVLGSILTGLATPTEASGLGAAGALVLAALSRKLSWSMLREVVRGTGWTTGMIIFVMIGATCFSAIFKRLGGDAMIEDAITGTALGPYGVLALLMGLIFVLGFFLEWVEISFVVLPLFAPVVAGFEFAGVEPDEVLVWFTILVAMNLQTSFLTPPFGYALFYIRGVAPQEVRTTDIYRGVVPFVLLQLATLGALIVFPGLALHLVRTLT